jgi:hypothetical protein
MYKHILQSPPYANFADILTSPGITCRGLSPRQARRAAPLREAACPLGIGGNT